MATKHAPRFWQSRDNCLAFFEHFAKMRKFKQMEDWYSVTASDIQKAGGIGILRRYKSFRECLQDIFPNYNWNILQFNRVPKGTWTNKINHQLFFEDIAKKMNIKNRRDWEIVTQRDIYNNKGFGLLKHYYGGSSMKAISAVVPSLQGNSSLKSFIEKRTMARNSISQIYLFKMISELLYCEEEIEIRMNYVFMDFVFSNSQQPIEFDVWIPKFRLAIEYQGRQHFYDKDGKDIFENNKEIKKRDEEKRKLSEENGISLIQIPYWWNKSLISLKDLILKRRPDLLPYCITP